MWTAKGLVGIAAFSLIGVLMFAPPARAHEEVAALRDTGATAKGAIDLRALDGPARDRVYSCDRSVMGVALARPWLDQDGTIYFADKPVIEGAVPWASVLTISETLKTLVIASNGLPSHVTGIFPVQRASVAFQYDRNPNSIMAQSLRYEIPKEPQFADAPSCLPMGTIGVAATGAVFFNALDAPGRDAVANEIFDLCEGHPQRQGLYHYHHASPCFAQGVENEHSPLAGYALDGFRIYGRRGENGAFATNAALDACHGHIGSVPDAAEIYHYHLTEEFPYTLGCFTGEVDVRYLRRRPGLGPGGPPR
ncbi:MAG: YHYH protein [Alphaproteobacteria bacterium]|nr:YHYH protein [Alphaproteobacteria bacterium]